MFTNRSTLSLLVLIAILVVLVRTAVFSVDTTQADIADSIDCYLEIARNLVAGKGYTLTACRMSDDPVPTAMRGPTVVYYFTAVLWLLGDHLWSLVVAQWLADVGTTIILFFIAMEIFHDRRIAVVACLLFAFYEPGLILTFRGYSEPVFTLVLTGFALSFLYLLRQPSIWRYSLCGLLLGMAMLARPVMQFYPLVIVPLVCWTLEWRWRPAFFGCALLCLVFAFVLSPWAVRNYFVFGAFIPGSTHSGRPFYEGNFALNQPDYLRHRQTEETFVPLRKALETHFGPLPDDPESAKAAVAKIRNKRVNPTATYAMTKGINEFQLNQFAFREAMKMIRASPGRYIVVSVVRFLSFWFHDRFVAYVLLGGQLPRAWLVAAFNAVLLGLATAAFVQLRSLLVQPAVLSLIVLASYNSVIYAATNAVGRYSVPIMPYVMIFAAFTIVQLFPRWVRIQDTQVQKAEANLNLDLNLKP